MTDSEFVENVGVGGGKISYCIVAQHQAFKHCFVDYASGKLLVSSNIFHACIGDSWPNDFSIDTVEINISPGLVRF